MAASVIISSDSHIVEPPDLYTKGMPSKLLDRAPVMKRYKNRGWKRRGRVVYWRHPGRHPRGRDPSGPAL